jgi:redox-sensing transcriptional repressor
MSEDNSQITNQDAAVPAANVPKAVVNRLSFYLREIQLLMLEGRETVSSSQLGKILGFTDAQVRKDLAYFGQFGYPGIGYRCLELVGEIRRILGTDQGWNVCLVGCGNMGRALLGYRGFVNKGFRIVAAFDSDPQKSGTKIGGLTIQSLHDLEQVVKHRGIRLAILAVPSDAAQQVAELLVTAGVDGILNFAPVTLSLKRSVSTQSIDLAVELEQLSFAVVKRENKN